MDELSNAQVMIYPNPFRETFHVQLDFVATAETTLKIMSLDGRIVYTDVFQAGQSDLEVSTAELLNGSYIVEVQSGLSTIRKTVVKL